MLDGRILTSCIHGLKHDDHAFDAMSVELVLQLAHLKNIIRCELLVFRFTRLVHLCAGRKILDLERALAFKHAIAELHSLPPLQQP